MSDQGQASNPDSSFEESEILTNESHRSELKGWLSSQKGKWHLLFRASRDGFAAATFHSKCDGQGPTVTIVTVKSAHGNYYIFGGFTAASWTSPSKFPGEFWGAFHSTKNSTLNNRNFRMPNGTVFSARPNRSRSSPAWTMPLPIFTRQNAEE